ncbi:MAG: T9SS type B sorting domain-containing protein, partial [Paludibacteraceae bacterium]|nr:T9SS type B sorting domain-containing protein [Paludibacteraceae bacterium]
DGNGINDTWAITNIEYYPEAEIRIYDRFHKQLVDYKGATMGAGWDGLYRGHDCGSDDYWYTITDEYFGTLAGHITLKR